MVREPSSARRSPTRKPPRRERFASVPRSRARSDRRRSKGFRAACRGRSRGRRRRGSSAGPRRACAGRAAGEVGARLEHGTGAVDADVEHAHAQQVAAAASGKRRAGFGTSSVSGPGNNASNAARVRGPRSGSAASAAASEKNAIAAGFDGGRPLSANSRSTAPRRAGRSRARRPCRRRRRRPRRARGSAPGHRPARTARAAASSRRANRPLDPGEVAVTADRSKPAPRQSRSTARACPSPCSRISVRAARRPADVGQARRARRARRAAVEGQARPWCAISGASVATAALST